MNGKYKILEEHSLPEDFRTIDQFKEGDYLKVVFIEKIKGVIKKRSSSLLELLYNERYFVLYRLARPAIEL